MNPINLRFSAIGIAMRHSKSKKQPVSQGFIGDYPGYNDGDVIVRTPAGKFHVVVNNNPVIAGITRQFREQNAFDPLLPLMSTPWVMELVRPAFKELKFMFMRGELPFSDKPGGAELYERLCEKPRKISTPTIERLLCEAMGYYYTSPSLDRPQRNPKSVILDLNHEFLQPPVPKPKKKAKSSPKGPLPETNPANPSPPKPEAPTS